MPKYKVSFYEEYFAEVSHTVTAKTEDEARDIAMDIHAEHVTPPEEIEFIEWNVDKTELIK